MTESIQDKKGIALVTGASRGIGKAIAEALANRGWDVIGTCRAPRSVPIKDRHQGIRYLPLDLCRSASVDALVKKVKRVDILVHNAGASPIGPAEEAPIEKVRELFELNFLGPVRLTQEYLPGMRERGRGAVIFIGSMRSEAPTPFSSYYSATKAALRSFAECLRMEVMGLGIKVAVIAPWGVRTTLPQPILMRKGSLFEAALRRVKKDRDRRIATAPSPHQVADRVMRIVTRRNPPPFIFVGKPVLSFFLRHLPRRLVANASARMVGLGDFRRR